MIGRGARLTVLTVWLGSQDSSPSMITIVETHRDEDTRMLDVTLTKDEDLLPFHLVTTDDDLDDSSDDNEEEDDWDEDEEDDSNDDDDWDDDEDDDPEDDD